MVYLKKVFLDTKKQFNENQFPFTVKAFSNGIDLDLSGKVIFLVGENGSGKSTLLEAIAMNCNFNLQGGGKNHSYESANEEGGLSEFISLAWANKTSKGFFLRAESFFNFANYIDTLAKDERGILNGYGGKSLHSQSHGEAFISLVSNRFKEGLFILDEPEAALSPTRQLSFLSLINELLKTNKSQFIIATHSPILLSYPNAKIYHLYDAGIEKIKYKDTEHYKLTKEFLDAPERYLHYMFAG